MDLPAEQKEIIERHSKADEYTNDTLVRPFEPKGEIIGRYKKVLLSYSEREELCKLLEDQETVFAGLMGPKSAKRELYERTDFEILDQVVFVLQKKIKQTTESNEEIRSIVRDEITNILSNHRFK